MKYGTTVPIEKVKDYKKEFSMKTDDADKNFPNPHQEVCDASICKQAKALKQALDIRKFEIGLYWTRTAYFSAFITLDFAGYFEILKAGNGALCEMKPQLLSISAVLGFILSLCWFLVNKASKYWQENWEHHVYLLEDEVMGPLYKTQYEVKSEKCIFKQVLSESEYSISKINQLLSFIVLLIWGFLFLYTIYKILLLNHILSLCTKFKTFGAILFCIVIFMLLVAFSTIFACCCKSSNKETRKEFTMRKKIID
ncbi:MAG: hypothetical protein LBS64_01695 [Spirochaetaceae bacterium]|jgi:hypothetical protein|nr:hypothetical protein [Spirochaetaceae bacterium]